MAQVSKNLNFSKRRKRCGSVLVLIVLVIFISMAIGTGLLTMGTNVRIASMGQVRDMTARSAADAGVEHAVQEINNALFDRVWSVGILPNYDDVTLYDADTSYSVKTAYSITDGYEVVSIGTYKDRTRIINARLRLKGLFENAIQCRDSIILKSGTVIDTIDSDISMDPADSDEKVIIGTTSTNDSSVILNSGVVVDGDVVVGVGGNVDTVIKDLGATTNDQYTLTDEVDFPVVTPPALPLMGTGITVKTGEKSIGLGGDYSAVGQYSDINLSQGTTLRIIGDCILYITGEVDMGQSSEIIFDTPDSSLTIYLDGNWISDNTSGINNTTSDTSSFSLYATGPAGQIIDLKAKSEFYGTIYAPDADLTIFSGGDVYGSFVANNFEMKNPAKFYYDAALQTVKVTDEGVRFVVSRWNEQ